MSTAVETINQIQTETQSNDLVKPINTENRQSKNQTAQSQTQNQEKNQHPLHQYDLTLMKKFYESCVGKFKEQNSRFQPIEWANMNPMPHNVSNEQRNEWSNPLVLSQKQRVYESFAKLARESGEPMVLMPNFDYGDISNFERFLQAMKQDGVNAIGKYKQYLNNKDMRKFEVDLVVIHPRYGVMLFEIKDCDHLDNKRRIRAKAQLNSARGCFESMGRLIAESNGWNHSEAHIQVTEFIALPNVQERPINHQNNQHNNSILQTPGGNQNHSASSTISNGRNHRQLNYLIKPDLENSIEFAKWWTKYIVEPKVQQQQIAETENKPNKFDLNSINCMIGLINCIRNNSIMPVVYPETGTFEENIQIPPTNTDTEQQNQQQQQPNENKSKEDEEPQQPSTQQNQDINKPHKETQLNQPALNVHGEFFQAEHETVRSLSKVVVVSKDSEKLRKAVCLQTMWFLLNDSQKKVSVVCSEMNKPYYTEFFARQRKLYNNLHNVRFYSNLESCGSNGQQHTIRKDGEIWFFDNGVSGEMSKIVETTKDLNAYWIFTTQEDSVKQHKEQLEAQNTKYISFDSERKNENEQETANMPWLTGTTLKFPLRLQCDLLIIGDLIGVNQLKPLYRYLKSNYVTNHASNYTSANSSSSYYHNQHQYQQQQQQQLAFNPSKKFKTVKFIRGGTIENLRNSLKMHDSIQSQVILIHVGDEDLFKVRNTANTLERVKELATLVKEYCPKSFVVLSTLMRRMSRTENTASSEVNKGIVSFCKQTRDTTNCYYMLNNHFEPDYHTQEGRTLNNKGLRLYVDNLLFMVDYFLIRNNKQH